MPTIHGYSNGRIAEITNEVLIQWTLMNPLRVGTSQQGGNKDMAVPNKEPTPIGFPYNPLSLYSSSNIVYGIYLYKRIVAALNANESYINVKVKNTQPSMPKTNPYFPKFSLKDISTLENEFEEWEYKDTWGNVVRKIHKLDVTLQTQAIWEEFRKEMLKWYSSSTKEIEVYIPHVIKFIVTRLSNQWSYAKESITNLYNSKSVSLWIREFKTHTKETFTEGEVYQKFNAFLNATKTFDADYRNLKLYIPPSLRRKACQVQAGREGNVITTIPFFERLYKTKYGRELPLSTIFWNDYYNALDISFNGTEAVEINGRAWVVPRSYLASTLLDRCFCCNTINHTKELSFVAQRHKKMFAFYSKPATERRKLARQEEFVRKNKNVVQPTNNSNYYKAPDKAPVFMHKTVSFLNEHITSFLSGSINNTTPDVDEYGINHYKEDLKEFPIESKYNVMGQGWLDSENKTRYFYVCDPCLSSLSWINYSNTTVPHHEEYSFPEERRTISRRMSDVILSHGTSPLVKLGMSKFMLGKGESKVIEKERIIDFGLGKFSYRNKDATLYMGVELEVCPKDSIYTDHLLKRCKFNRDKFHQGTMYNETTWVAANVTKRFFDEQKIALITHDSSTGNGFEIVSLPGTHKWHTEEAWNGFFREDYEDEELKALAPANFLCGWVNNGGKTNNTFLNEVGNTHRPICGIHIHFSRDAITPLQLGKIKYFLNTHTDFISRIAGRSDSNFSRYIPSKVKDGALFKNKRQQNNTTSIDTNSRSRYVALNLNTGKPTFEIRIFRSNVAKAGFMKNIDFVHALVSWCGTAAPAQENKITVSEFCNWLETRKGTYKWLTKWMINQKYMQSVHKFKPGYTKEYDFIDDNEENMTDTKMLAR